MTDIDDIESMVDDIESRADDLESDVEEAKDGIKKLSEDLNIWGLFDEKMIPYIYDKILYKVLKNLEDKNYKDAVGCFRNLENKFDIPYPLNIENYSRKKRIFHCTIYLKNAKEFYETGKIASSDTKPIFYYYSISYLFAFLMRSFVDFHNPKRHHGIYANTDNGISGIRFNYNMRGGVFERLVQTLSMLDFPSSFSSFIIDIDNKQQTVLKEQKTVISISNKSSILLSELLEYNFENDYIKLEFNKHRAGIHSRYVKTSEILRDFILIFVACYIARYEPAIWRDIYSGEDSKLILNFEKSFNNINNMIRLINNIVTKAERGYLLI